MKKILLISSEFPPLPGGIGNHAFNLAKELDENSFDITVITNHRTVDFNDDLEFDSKNSFKTIRVKRYKFVIKTYIERISKTYKTIANSEDCVIIASGKFSLWIATFLNLFFNNQTIAILHGSEIRAGNYFSRLITKWSLSKFNKIIAVSNFTKQFALQNMHFLTIEVVNNGFRNFESSNYCSKIDLIGHPNIVTVGNVTFRKGQNNVIKALPKIKELFPNVHYHIIGIPTEKIKFEKLARELKVNENCTFYGSMSNEKMQSVLSSSDVFIMLSDILKNGDFEGFGIALLEANSLGLPSIGSNNCGINDAVNTMFSGILVNPHDEIEIKEALKIIMDDYDTFSLNSKEWAKKFHWDNVVKNYIRIINE